MGKRKELAHLGKALTGLLESTSGVVELSLKPRRLGLGELKLVVDDLLVAPEVTNDTTKLLDRAVVAGGDGVDAVLVGGGGSLAGRSVADGLTSLKVGRLRGEGLEVLVEKSVLGGEVVAAMKRNRAR